MPKIKSTDLQVNKPMEGAAPDSMLVMEVEARNPLRAGEYIFQLTVTDDSGNVSSPAHYTIFVGDDTKPTAIITGPRMAPTGTGFSLSGADSFDPAAGKIVKYVWTLLKAPR